MSDEISKKNVKFITDWLREYQHKYSRMMDTVTLIKFIQSKLGYPFLSSKYIYEWMDKAGLHLENTFTYICPNHDCGVNVNFIFLNEPDRTRLKGVFLTDNHDIGNDYKVITGSDQKAYFDRVGPKVDFAKPSELFGFEDKITSIDLIYRFLERRVSFELLTQLFEAGFKENIRIDLEVRTTDGMIGYRLLDGKMISSEISTMFEDKDYPSFKPIKHVSLSYLQEFHTHCTQLIDKILKD